MQDPKAAHPRQTLVVIEEYVDGHSALRVRHADMMDEPVSWGVYLADIARVIAEDFADENALAEIKRGFNSGNGFVWLNVEPE